MGLEAATYVQDLDSTNPVSGDLRSQGDDHLRLLKSTLKSTFPTATKPFNFPRFSAVSIDTTLASTDDNKTVVVDASGGAKAITLPTLTTANAGWVIRIVKGDTSTNAVTISPPSGTIDGASNVKCRDQYECATIYWTGTEYIVLNDLPTQFRIVSKTAGATLDDSEMRSIVVVAPSAGTATIVLPTAVDKDGDWVIVRRNHASNNVVIDANSTETIDGSLTFTFGANLETICLVARSGNWIVAWHYSGTPSAAPVYPPQGYCTLSESSGFPYITGDMVSKTAIYYDFATGDQIPITTDGVNFRMRRFTRMTLTLNTAHAASTLYDLYVWDESGTLTFGSGPAWSDSSAGASSRGTGAGTAEITFLNGLAVNANSMTMRNGATTYTVGAGKATLVGTFLVDATQGEITHHVTWGGSRRIPIGNLYNRRKVTARQGDNTSTWSLNSVNWRQSRADTNNRVLIVTCMPGMEVEARFVQGTPLTAIVSSQAIGIGVNVTNAASGLCVDRVFTSGGGPSQNNGTLYAEWSGPVAAGFNQINAVERTNNTQSVFFRGTEADMQLTVRIEA